MAAKRGKTFDVDTSPTKAVVVDGLTRDATVHACVYDLVDNSIDAARDAIFAGLTQEAQTVLPGSYAGHRVNLTLSGDGLTVEDDCGGMGVAQFGGSALRFGQPSERAMGIGAFGVGLNRAIFKLGRHATVTTQDGRTRAEVRIDVAAYLASSDWNLVATEARSNSPAGTRVSITKPTEEIGQLFASPDWVGSLRADIGSRYGRFIAKGLVIEVNGVPAVDGEIPIRADGPYEGEYKVYRTDDGVSVHLRYGQHERHRFAKEEGYDRQVNVAITKQFGWTVYCNDRAIVLSDRTDKVGWDTKFHTEFNGFVGHASFSCAEPRKLPWDTTKTDVDLNNRAYRLALRDMRTFAEKWRQLSEERKRAKGVPKPLPARPDGRSERPGQVRPGSLLAGPLPSSPSLGPVGAPSGPVRKPGFAGFRTVLPGDVDQRHCQDKLLAVVHEAQELDLGDYTYSGLILLRLLFEMSLHFYLFRRGELDVLKANAAAQRRKTGLTLTPDDEKKMVPTLDEGVAFLDRNPHHLGTNAQMLKHLLATLSRHKKTLNSVVHNHYQTHSAATAFTIRDELLPLLRHFIESD